jgi:hypothetical protein
VFPDSTGTMRSAWTPKRFYGEETARRTALRWRPRSGISRLLRDGSVDAKEGWDYMDRAGHTRSTTRRAIEELYIQVEPVRDKKGQIVGHSWRGLGPLP